jgi:hypothetical protein
MLSEPASSGVDVDSHVQGGATDSPDPGPGATSRRRGPRTLWIVVLAAAILVLGVIVTVAPVISFANAAPTVTFASGVPAVVTVDDPAAEPRIYLSAAQPGRAECGVLDGPAREGVSLSSAAGERAIEVDGVTWRPMFDVHVPVPGEYQVICEYESQATFGVGAPLGIGSSDGFRNLLFAATAAMAGVLGVWLRSRRSGR